MAAVGENRRAEPCLKEESNTTPRRNGSGTGRRRHAPRKELEVRFWGAGVGGFNKDKPGRFGKESSEASPLGSEFGVEGRV